MSFSKYLSAGLLLVALSCGKSSPDNPPTPTPAPPTTPTTTTTFTNPLTSSGPDPWVYQKDGTYYYMRTTGGDLRIRKTAKMSELGTSVEKVIWTPPAGNTYRDIWAPELYFFDGKWYVYFSADAYCCGGHRVWVLENAAADPTTGTWTLVGKINTSDDNWAIDGTVLEQNGQRYLVWSGHRDFGNSPESQMQRLYIAKMSSPTTLTGARVEISQPTYSWERNGTPLVNEGPEALHHNDKTFLVYSASHCSTDDYCLGLLTASATADPMLPASWTKTATPVFTKNPAGNAFGPGHNGFFLSKDNTENWLIYHANSQTGQGCGDARSPRMQKFTWNADGTPSFGTPVAVGTALPKPSGE